MKKLIERLSNSTLINRHFHIQCESILCESNLFNYNVYKKNDNNNNNKLYEWIRLDNDREVIHIM